MNTAVIILVILGITVALFPWKELAMSYLDEQHARASIRANALPRYRRVLRPGWLGRLFGRVISGGKAYRRWR